MECVFPCASSRGKLWDRRLRWVFAIQYTFHLFTFPRASWLNYKQWMWVRAASYPPNTCNIGRSVLSFDKTQKDCEILVGTPKSMPAYSKVTRPPEASFPSCSLEGVGTMATGGRANSSHCVGTFYLLLMLFGTMARTASISGPQDCSRS